MKNNLKKLLCAALSTAMIAGSIVLPMTASAETTPIFDGDTVEQEWKFDFGAAGTDAEDGYTLVTPDTNYVTNKEYGFLGIDEDSYKLGNRLDGFGNQKGQVIKLKAGGGTGLNDAIGSVEKDSFGNAGDVYYPTRFALKADDEAYYRVRATVTTLDTTKDAEISLYTERKHPIFTDTKVEAGQTKTVEFSVRPTPIYYEKSEPKGTIADGMVNVSVVGENSAIASIEIQKVQSYPVFWVLGDSTVTDGNCSLPFFRLQNYTGVGTGLTKYLPRNYAMVNEGEGGLNAADNYHFNMVKDRIKAGDYLYVEYGHNHKSDGPTGYVSNLDKYYNACHSVGATLVIVSPIERINTFTDGAYQHTLDGFATAGAKYVADKVTAGATDIAYVDLNSYSLDFYNKITTDNGGDSGAIKFYFQTAKGGGTDQTHPNDAGAENLAYEFVKAAKAVTDETQKAALAPVVNNFTDETPNLVSTEITSLGAAPNDAWPQYVVPTDNEYPVVIKDIKFNEAGEANYAKVLVQDAKIDLGAYGIIVITVKDENGEEKGKIYAIDQVDNSTGNGTQEITHFTTDVKLEEGDTYTATVWKAKDNGGDAGLTVDPENVQYSAEYIPTDVEEQYLLNEDKDGNEQFGFYGATYDGKTSSLKEFNDWTQIGSAGITAYLNQTSDETKYVEITSDGAKNGSANQGSFYYSKDLSTEIGTTGRYLVSADVQYVSGGGMTFNLVTGHNDKHLGGTESLNLFTIGSGGVITAGDETVGTISATALTNVQYILDMDLGKATVSVGGGTPVEIALDNYQTTELTVTPSKITQFLFGGSKVAFDNKVANLSVAKLKDQKLPSYTIGVRSNDTAKGSVTLSYATPEPTATTEPTEATATAAPTATAEAKDNETATVNTLADGDVTLTVTADKAVVTATKALTAVLVEAQYAENGTIKKVTTTPVTFEEAGVQDYTVTTGSKVMLWDSLQKMTPLTASSVAPAPTVAPTATPIPDSEYTMETLPLNNVVTLKATANEGYVFRGWKTESGTTLSMDDEYTFRLRGDSRIVANFVNAPTVADITDFELSLSPASVKSTSGSTSTVSIKNAKDAAGTPMDAVTNTDVAWSCDETGVTIAADGTVTIGDGFSMGDSLTKNVTIKGTLNGVTKTAILTVFGYEYYEDMAEGSTNYTGQFMTISGKTAIVFPGSSQTKTFTFGSPVTLDKTTTVKFDHVWSKSKTCGQLRTLNFKNSSGTTIFSMTYKWAALYAGSTATDGLEAAAVEQNKYTTVTVTVDPETKVVTVTDGTKSATTTLADNAGDIASVDFASASSVPNPEDRAIGISNFTVIK